MLSSAAGLTFKSLDTYTLKRRLLTSVNIALTLSKVRFVKSSSIKSFKIFLKSAPWVLRPENDRSILTLVKNLYLFFAPAIANKFPGFQRKQHLHNVCHFIFVNLLWITIQRPHIDDQAPSSKRKGTTRLQ